ncbi:hypothetical protein ACP4OV_011910 [Aristida adscensionis]
MFPPEYTASFYRSLSGVNGTVVVTEGDGAVMAPEMSPVELRGGGQRARGASRPRRPTSRGSEAAAAPTTTTSRGSGAVMATERGSGEGNDMYICASQPKRHPFPSYQSPTPPEVSNQSLTLQPVTVVSCFQDPGGLTTALNSRPYRRVKVAGNGRHFGNLKASRVQVAYYYITDSRPWVLGRHGVEAFRSSLHLSRPFEVLSPIVWPVSVDPDPVESIPNSDPNSGGPDPEFRQSI